MSEENLHEKNRLEREALGDNPQCPDCKNILSESIIVPYWLVCEKCEILISPSFNFKKKLKEVWK